MSGRTAVAFLLILGALFGGVVGSQYIVDAVGQDELNHTVESALVVNCENDESFRRQYKRRATAEKKLFRILVVQNESLIEVVNAITLRGDTLPEIERLGKALDKANRHLNDVRATITILPLPNCEQLRQALDTVLRLPGGSGSNRLPLAHVQIRPSDTG